jgi:hypothetical protein
MRAAAAASKNNDCKKRCRYENDSGLNSIKSIPSVNKKTLYSENKVTYRLTRHNNPKGILTMGERIGFSAKAPYPAPDAWDV